MKLPVVLLQHMKIPTAVFMLLVTCFCTRVNS